MNCFYRRNNFHLIVLLIISVLITACTSIKLIGDYDERIDEGITALQKMTETQLLAIEEKRAKYKSTKHYYDKAKIEVSSLRIRADAIERNSLTVKMLDKLANNIRRLEEAHKEGINPEEVKLLFRGGFNSQFTAILTFELAKKRGESPNPDKAIKAPTPTVK